MEITACPKCGSRKIFQGNIGEGVLTGYTSRNVCKDCGYQGMPLIFDSENEYKKFLEGLAKDKECKEEDGRAKTRASLRGENQTCLRSLRAYLSRHRQFERKDH